MVSQLSGQNNKAHCLCNVKFIQKEEKLPLELDQTVISMFVSEESDIPKKGNV